jgi:DNA polymerase
MTSAQRLGDLEVSPPPAWRISIDFETYSEAGYTWNPFVGRWVGKGLKDVGHHLYARHPSTEVLCLAYGPRLWVPSDPVNVGPFAAFLDRVRQGWELAAWNADFEFQIWNHVCVPRYGFPELRPEQLFCSMAKARCYGLPGKLEDASRFFPGLDVKQEQGAALLRRYSKPRSPSKNNRALRRFLPSDPRFDPAAPTGSANPYEDEMLLTAYCVGDVKAEASVAAKCPPISPIERKVYLLDQKINDRGIAVDMFSLEQLQSVVDRERVRAEAQLAFVTDVSPYQVEALRVAINDALKRCGSSIRIDNLQKDTVAETLARTDLPADVRIMLEGRQAVSHSSVAKLDAIRRRVCLDGRVRGLFQYYGAERTGRWAGRGAQPQNLPRGDGRAAPFDGPVESLDDVASGLRSLFVAGPGCDLIAADYSAIEAVVLAELAGERWRHDVFVRREDIYSKTAEMITGMPTPSGEKHPQRQLGKIAELASGYGGGVGAWRAFGHEGEEEEIKLAVRAWRDASPNIVRFWWGLEDAAKAAIRSPGDVVRHRSITYRRQGDVLQCILPSGRSLYYHDVRLEDRPTPWGETRETVTYSGRDVFSHRWTRLKTYGGKLCENVVQAVARDLLAYAMLRADEAHYPIVGHVHDEIIAEVPHGFGSVEELCSLMTILPTWARGWAVFAAGWRGGRYRKD